MLIYTDPIKRKFYAPALSFAGLSVLIFYLGLVVVAFLIGYGTDGFWLKQIAVREQPNVRFMKNIILSCDGTKSSVPNFITWSTYADYNAIASANLRVPAVKTFENDTNNDGKYDSLNFEIELPLSDTEIVNDVKLLLMFDYEFSSNINLKMQSLAYIYYSSPLAGSHFSTEGQLMFNQKSLLGFESTRTLYDTSIVNATRSAGAYSFRNILREYNKRNDTTVFTNSYPVWSSNRGSGQPFIISGTIDYTEQEILLIPGFWETLKFAYVQFIAIAYLLYLIVRHIRHFLYTNQLVTTQVIDSHELTKKKFQ
eukprot:Nk52_evm72s1444 gene=Nk52_evmTU72s1444